MIFVIWLIIFRLDNEVKFDIIRELWFQNKLKSNNNIIWIMIIEIMQK